MIDFLPAVIILVFLGVYLIGALWVDRRFVPPYRLIIVGRLKNATKELQRVINSIDRFAEATILLTARMYEINGVLRLKQGVTLRGMSAEETILRAETKE